MRTKLSPLQFWYLIVGVEKFVLRWHQVALWTQKHFQHFSMYQTVRAQIIKPPLGIKCATFNLSCSLLSESYSSSSWGHKTPRIVGKQQQLNCEALLKQRAKQCVGHLLLSKLTSCSILDSLSLLASFSFASLQPLCIDSSSCRIRLIRRATEASFSFSERLLSSRRCCRDLTVAPATA